MINHWLSSALILVELIVYSRAFLSSPPRCHPHKQRHYPKPSVVLHASTIDEGCTRSTIKPEANEGTSLFLRFSPLVGGPPFLPLHVEVLLVPTLQHINLREQKRQIDAILKNATNNDYFDVHRFDFLPANPRDVDTIVRLLMLQAVAGNVRYRHLPAVQNGGAVKTGGNKRIEEKGVTILLCLGSSCSILESQSSILSTAKSFADEYKTAAGKELRILGGKNCVSFALDMLLHLNEMHGIDVCLSMPRIF